MTPSSMRPGTAAFAWPAGMMPSPIIWVMVVTVVARLASSLIIWLWSIASDRCWVRASVVAFCAMRLVMSSPRNVSMKESFRELMSGPPCPGHRAHPRPRRSVSRGRAVDQR